MCPELPPGRWAAGHGIGNCIFPCLGLDDGTLWRPNVGFDQSNQRPYQQKLVLDKMVRNVKSFKSYFSFPILMAPKPEIFFFFILNIIDLLLLLFH